MVTGMLFPPLPAPFGNITEGMGQSQSQEDSDVLYMLLYLYAEPGIRFSQFR